jgi:hypothetical protein
VVGDWGGVVESVSAHLDGREIFYVNRDAYGTYATYVPDRVPVTWFSARAVLMRFSDAVLVTSILTESTPIDPTTEEHLRTREPVTMGLIAREDFDLIAQFVGSTAGLEDFAVYRLADG